jgi:SAM-dependent methyltransferase
MRRKLWPRSRSCASRCGRKAAHYGCLMTLKGITHRLDEWAQAVRPYLPFTALNTVWRGFDRQAVSVLDVGAGRGRPMRFLRRRLRFYAVGVDIFRPYLQECQRQGVYDDYVQVDARSLPFQSDSFDAVLCMEVLEHLEREEGLALIAALEQIARRQVIISTPVGAHHQHDYDGNPYQEHKYIWQPGELKRLGYRVIGHGLRGLGGMSGIQSPLPRMLRPLVDLAWILAGPVASIRPECAGNMVASKSLTKTVRQDSRVSWQRARHLRIVQSGLLQPRRCWPDKERSGQARRERRSASGAPLLCSNAGSDEVSSESGCQAIAVTLLDFALRGLNALAHRLSPFSRLTAVVVRPVKRWTTDIWKYDDDVAAYLTGRAHLLKRVYQSLSQLDGKRLRYLDIGAGNGFVSQLFGADFGETIVLDLKARDWTYDEGYNAFASSQVKRLVATAETLPFNPSSFDLVSMFSMLEYVPNQRGALAEAMAVLRPGGELFIQVLNRHFWVELQTGLPNPFLLPRFLRVPVLRMLGYHWLLKFNHPSARDLKRLVAGLEGVARSEMRTIVWPDSFAPRRVRPVYSMLRRLGLFKLCPPAYAVLCQKAQ